VKLSKNAGKPRPPYDQAEMPGRLFDAARAGDVGALAGMLDRDPELLQAREPPYDWTLLHAAAAAGHLAAVDLLLTRGLDVNVRETGDNTYAMHWAAAAGHLDVVRRLADAGGDVVGAGDDHAFEVIGWATCWEPSHDDVAEFLVSRGARHHIFSAIALNLDAEVRRIVAADPGALSRRLSRNEDHQLPLHFAVGKDSAEMVAVLVELGADPLGVDGSGHTAAAYASSPGVDLAAMEAIHAMTGAELVSAARGQRAPSLGTIDLVAALALGDFDSAGRLFPLVEFDGALHLMAKPGGRRSRQLVARSWRGSQRPLEPLGCGGDAAAPGRLPRPRARCAPAPRTRRRPGHARQHARQRRARLGRVLPAVGDRRDPQAPAAGATTPASMTTCGRPAHGYARSRAAAPARTSRSRRGSGPEHAHHAGIPRFASGIVS
jgi:hypothetical protein